MDFRFGLPDRSDRPSLLTDHGYYTVESLRGSGIGQPPLLDQHILSSIAGSGSVRPPLLDRPIFPPITGSGSVQPTFLDRPILPSIASSGSVQPPFFGAAPIGEPILHSSFGLPNPSVVASRPIPHGINWPARLPDPMPVEPARMPGPMFVEPGRMLDPALVEQARMRDPALVEQARMRDPALVEQARMLDPVLVEQARMLDPVLIERELAELRKRDEIALRGIVREIMREEGMQQYTMRREAMIKKREEAQQHEVESPPLSHGNIGEPSVPVQAFKKHKVKGKKGKKAKLSKKALGGKGKGISKKKKKEKDVKVICFFCEKPGHWKRNCRMYLASLKKEKLLEGIPEKGE